MNCREVVECGDKDRHQVFIEPEGLSTNEMYIDGMSSSMPEYVQYEMYHSVEGLEHAQIVRNAYAIEYDCLEPNQLKPTLEFKKIKGLFSGGQFNGSSGYEEAAAQGLVAGINAAQELLVGWFCIMLLCFNELMVKVKIILLTGFQLTLKSATALIR